MTADMFAPWPEPPYVATLRSNVAALTAALDAITAERDDLMALAVEDTHRRGEVIERAESADAALDAITEACTEACDNRRRTYPTYGLVSAALIAAIAEEAKR